MRRLFTMMWDQVQSTAQQLRHWWTTLSLDPNTWLPFTWVLVGAASVVVLVLVFRPRRRPRRLRPELLISHGELRVEGATSPRGANLQAPARGDYQLSMTVSNLSAVPVQLLELAVKTNASATPTTAEVPALLPPHGAVEVRAELRGAGGDEGTVELYVYAPDLPPKTFRVRASLRWEPWNARFRVMALDQDVVALRRPADRQRRSRPRRASPPRTGGASIGRSDATQSRARARREAAVEVTEAVRFEPRPGSEKPRERTGPADRSQQRSAADAPRGAGSAPVWPPIRPARADTEPPSGARSAPTEASGGVPVGERVTVGRDDPARRAAALRRDAERREAERREAERREAERQVVARRRAERQAAERRQEQEPPRNVATKAEPAQDVEAGKPDEKARALLEFPDDF